jgi:hypothetical protein
MWKDKIKFIARETYHFFNDGGRERERERERWTRCTIIVHTMPRYITKVKKIA